MTDQDDRGQRLPDAEVHHGWARFDEGHMGLPVPAVAMPTADLYQPDLAALGFVRVAAVFTGAEVSRTRHLLANISADRERLTVIVSRRELYGVDEHDLVFLSENADTKMITGRYNEPATRAWQRRTQRGRQIMLIAGPRPSDGQNDTAYMLDSDSMVALVALTE